jgi:hypothetical protein
MPSHLHHTNHRGDVLRASMRRTGQTANAVATRAGASVHAVRSWLGGHPVPQSLALARLESALDLSTDYLSRYLNAEQVTATEHAVVHASELDQDGKAKLIGLYDELRRDNDHRPQLRATGESR